MRCPSSSLPKLFAERTDLPIDPRGPEPSFWARYPRKRFAPWRTTRRPFRGSRYHPTTAKTNSFGEVFKTRSRDRSSDCCPTIGNNPETAVAIVQVSNRQKAALNMYHDYTMLPQRAVNDKRRTHLPFNSIPNQLLQGLLSHGSYQRRCAINE